MNKKQSPCVTAQQLTRTAPAQPARKALRIISDPTPGEETINRVFDAYNEQLRYNATGSEQLIKALSAFEFAYPADEDKISRLITQHAAGFSALLLQGMRSILDGYLAYLESAEDTGQPQKKEKENTMLLQWTDEWMAQRASMK